MARAERKPRGKPEEEKDGKAVLSDEQAKVLADQHRIKELKDMNGGKLSEQTDAGREIAQAQQEAEAQEVKPNGHDKDEQKQVNLKGKPPMLSDSAEIERKKNLDEAFKASYNLGLRMTVAIGYPAILAGFSDRPAGSVTLDEFIDFRGARLAELPEKGNYHTFSWEANGYVNNLFLRTKKIVQDFFKSRYDVQLAEVKAKVIEIEKPKQFSMEAELERQADIENAFKKSDNEGRRMIIAVSFRAINEAFPNDAADSVTPELYRKFRDSHLAKLPVDANYFKFSQEALDFLRLQKQHVQDQLREIFNGELDVQLAEVQDELMMLNAEAAIRYDNRKKQGLRIDEDAYVVQCATDHDEPVRFVAMVWMEDGQETGNFYIVNNKMVPACDTCRGMGIDTVEFLSYTGAKKKIKALESSATLFANALKKVPQQERGNEYPHRQYKPITEEEKRAASKDIKALLSGGMGPFFIKHPTWEVKVDGKVVQRGTWIYVVGDGYNNITITGAGKGFGNLIGSPQILHNLPSHLFRFLSEVKNLSRTD